MNLNYKMIVDVYDPNTPDGMFSGLRLYLFCEVLSDVNDYGNGCYISIRGEGFSKQIFDVRFDKSFHLNEPDVWLKKWAENYWNGVYGVWAIRRLQIIKLY